MDLKLLKEIKTYIEETEECIDGEWGEGRSVDKLIKDGDMPKIYNDVIEKIDKLER